MEIISKKDSLSLNKKWFFTGLPCKNNHIDKRYINTGICYACKRERSKRWSLTNKDSVRKISKKTYNKNKEKYFKRSKDWVDKNRTKSNQIKKDYKTKNKDVCLEKNRVYQKKKREDPAWRLSRNMSKGIWECLKNKKNQTTWLKFIDFSLSDLIKHLENKFDSEMNWNNYGSYWHVDHIKPLSWFNLDLEFKDAWCLNNLQPLEGKKNYSKCNRYIG